MEASEFVKIFGWEESKVLVNAQSLTMRQIALSTTVDTKELTRLVESHELVEKVGGLSMAKDFYENFECVHVGLDLVSCRSLGKAILDVESCK